MTDLTLSNSLTDLAARICAEHAAAVEAIKRGVEHAIAAGELLIEAKRQVRHGRWLHWLKDNCSISERTAQLYMRLARERELIKSAKVADLDFAIDAAASQLGIKAADELLRKTRGRWPGFIPDEGRCLLGIFEADGEITGLIIVPSDRSGYHFLTQFFIHRQRETRCYGLQEPVRSDFLDAAIGALPLSIMPLRRDWRTAYWFAPPCRLPQNRNVFVGDGIPDGPLGDDAFDVFIGLLDAYIAEKASS